MNITNEFWDFIEKYYPDYHASDDILRHSNLKLFFDGHESDCSGEEGFSVAMAERELNTLSLNIMDKAIDAYTKGLGIECEYCKMKQGCFCSHCGKK